MNDYEEVKRTLDLNRRILKILQQEPQSEAIVAKIAMAKELIESDENLLKEMNNNG